MGATTARSVPLAGDTMRRQAEAINRQRQAEEQMRRQQGTRKAPQRPGEPQRSGESLYGQDYYTPDRLRQDWERLNPRKSFANYLNEAENKYGKGSMDVIRSGLGK